MKKDDLYQKFNYKIYEPANPDQEASKDGKWWLLDDEDICHSVFAIANNIETQQLIRNRVNLTNARCYSNRNLLGLNASKFGKLVNTGPKDPRRLKINVIRACVDTICAKISKNRPEIRFLTSGADWELQEKARLATKFIDGLFEDCNFYEEAQKVFRDGVVQDIGALKIYVEDDKIKVVRVFPEELLVDEEDGAYGKPTSLYQRCSYAAQALANQYPEFTSYIRNAADNGRVEAIESWHLPTSKNSKDGKHAISINNKTIFSEPWEKDYFPIVTSRWSESLRGYYGTSLVEEILPIQEEINTLLKQIQKGLEGAIPRAFFDSTSMINKANYTDEIWSAMTYTGRPPMFSPTSAFTPEVYNFLWQLVNKAYEISGISQMSANGVKVPGVDAAVAMRELQDIETQRFALPAQRWERFIVDCAKVMLDLISDLAKSKKGFSVKIQDGPSVKNIDWLTDIDLEQNQFLIKAYPVSQLPQTPTGRLSMVSELMAQGIIQSRETALSLLNILDLEKFVSLETAGTDNVQLIISLILNKGIYNPPSKYLPLEMAIKAAQNALLRGINEGRDEDRLDLLRQFIEECSQLLDEMNASSQGPAPPPNPPMPTEAGVPPMDPNASPMEPTQLPPEAMPNPEGMPN